MNLDEGIEGGCESRYLFRIDFLGDSSISTFAMCRIHSILPKAQK
jgi:hypothetical protein